MNFTLFTPKLPPLGVGGHEIYISCLQTIKMLHINFVYDWPSSSEKKMLTHNGCRTTHNNRMPALSNRSSEWPKYYSQQILLQYINKNLINMIPFWHHGSIFYKYHSYLLTSLSHTTIFASLKTTIASI